MRCKLCEIPHKNRGKSPLWIEFQVCRACSYVLDVFSWNANYLKEYWNVSDISSIKFKDNTLYYHDHNFIDQSSSYRIGSFDNGK